MTNLPKRAASHARTSWILILAEMTRAAEGGGALVVRVCVVSWNGQVYTLRGCLFLYLFTSTYFMILLSHAQDALVCLFPSLVSLTLFITKNFHAYPGKKLTASGKHPTRLI